MNFHADIISNNEIFWVLKVGKVLNLKFTFCSCKDDKLLTVMLLFDGTLRSCNVLFTKCEDKDAFGILCPKNDL